jgi:hypothetical protein
VQDSKPCHYQIVYQLYKRIQIIERYFNNFLQNGLAPAMVIIVPCIQITGQYVCIKLHSQIPMPGFLLFPLILFDAGLHNIVVFSMASSIHNASTETLATWKRIHGGKKKSWERKQIKACSAMKVKFGSNYMDRSTALVIQNFCMTTTMSLLLIKSTK